MLAPKCDEPKLWMLVLEPRRCQAQIRSAGTQPERNSSVQSGTQMAQAFTDLGHATQRMPGTQAGVR